VVGAVLAFMQFCIDVLGNLVHERDMRFGAVTTCPVTGFVTPGVTQNSKWVLEVYFQ